MKKLDTLKQYIANFGYFDTLVFIWISVLNKAIGFQQLEIVIITQESLNRSYLDLPQGYNSAFVDRDSLIQQAQLNSQLELEESFLDQAFKKQDRCYGIFHGEELISYGWYSNQPTDISDELVFQFDSSYVYMYKGLTLKSHRGRRLHAIGMSQALLAVVESGSRAIVSYVERGNLASLRSIYRMGYKKLGSIYIFRICGRFFSIHTPGTRSVSAKVSSKNSRHGC